MPMLDAVIAQAGPGRLRAYPIGATLRVSVHGQNGTLEVNDDHVRLFIDEARAPYAAGWTVWRKPDLFEGVSLDVGGPEYTRQDEEFLRAAATKGRVASDVDSAVRVQQVIEAIYQSSAEGRTVSIEAAA